MKTLFLTSLLFFSFNLEASNFFNALRFLTHGKKQEFVSESLEKDSYSPYTQSYLRQNKDQLSQILLNQIRSGSEKGVKLILKHKVNLKDEAFALECVKHNKFAILQSFVDHLKNKEDKTLSVYEFINQTDDQKVTALSFVSSQIASGEIKQSDLDFFNYLIKHEASLNAQDSLGHSALMILSRGVYTSQSQKALKTLLQKGAHTNLKDYQGRTALFESHQKFIPLLKRYGANLHHKDKKAKSLLHAAIENGNKKLYYYLLTQGLKVGKDSAGKKPLDYLKEKKKFQNSRLPASLNLNKSFMDQKSIDKMDSDPTEKIDFSDFY